MVYKCLFFSGTARPRALVRLPALGREGGKAFWSQGRPADSSASLTVPPGPRWRLQGLEACVLGEERHVSHGKKRSQYLPSVAFHTNHSSCHIDQEPGPEHSPRPPAGKAVPISQMGGLVWSPCTRHLPPPEMLGSPPLKSVPLLEACLLSLQQGRSASLPAWGRRPWVAGGFVTTPGPSLSLSAVVRCFLVVTVGQGAWLVHPTALQEITRLSRRAVKTGGTPAICPSLRKCLIL